MFLLAAATDMELAPVKKTLGSHRGFDFLKTGVGPVAAAYSLTRYLAETESLIAGVINFGVAGAYLDTQIKLLDICLADKEVLADLGICFADSITPLTDTSLNVEQEFDLRNSLLETAEYFFKSNRVDYRKGPFATVSCVSGTQNRGAMLKELNQVICENMEGAAIAKVCVGFGIESLELRSVSNMVEDRNPSHWKLAEAVEAAALQTTQLVEHLLTSR